MYTYRYAYKCVYIHIHIHLYVNTYTYIFIYIHTYTHIYISDTQSDPRDSFAQAPNRAKEYHYHGLPYTVTPSEKRVITKDALHILPNIEKREQAAEAKAKMSESKLEQELGFDSSVLMSHSFDAALKHG